MAPPAPAPRAGANARTYEIDGIRGWASFLVLLFHVYWEMYGGLVPEIRNPWVGILLNDRLAIMAFFILSGDSLGSAYFHRGRSGALWRQILKRYFRLTVPVLMCALLVYTLMRTGLDFHRPAAVVVNRPGWLAQFLDFEPTIPSLLRYSLWDVYITTAPHHAYNPFLWTMQVEMLGSILVYVLCACWKRVARPAWIVGATAAVFFVVAPLMCAFCVGLLLSYARKLGVLERWCANRHWQWLSLVSIVLVFAASILRPGAHAGLAVACLLIPCLYTQRRLRGFFDSTLSRRLGRLSYPLYLVQFPVIISLMSWLLLSQAGDDGRLSAFALTWVSLVTIFACFLLAWAFVPFEARVRGALDALITRAPRSARSLQRHWVRVLRGG